MNVLTAVLLAVATMILLGGVAMERWLRPQGSLPQNKRLRVAVYGTMLMLAILLAVILLRPGTKPAANGRPVSMKARVADLPLPKPQPGLADAAPGLSLDVKPPAEKTRTLLHDPAD